jgi:hypothetical protein
MANYAREKSRYGGCTGSIIIHSTPGIGFNNDPTTAVFRENLPAGYLKCDGSVLNAKDYVALSQVLGVGEESRFKRENVNLRDADPLLGDLGQFQLPDLGSKVVLGGRGTGTYNNDFVDTDVVQATPINRVGPQIQVISNFGNTITSSYLGNATLFASGELPFLGNPKYIIPRSTTETALNIENFQGHAHRSNQNYLNYTGNHEIGSDGGKNSGALNANSGAYNSLDTTAEGGRESIHKHDIIRPASYSHDFTYRHGQVQIDMTGVSASVTVDVSDEEKLDQLVTPFILVEYLIKF